MRIGLIGCGKIGARHLDAYDKIGDVEVVVTDEDEARAKSTADQWNVETVAVTDLLEQTLDAVDVCVPTASHREWIVRSLDAGFHVFCEKPLCASYPEALEILEAARRASRNVTVGYLYRYHPAFQFAKETIEHGIIGGPYFAIARLGGRGSHRPWKHHPNQGGGVVFEMTVHMLDILSWLLGPLSEGRLVYRSLVLPSRQIGEDMVNVTADDAAIAVLKAGGVESVCQSDLLTPSFMNYLEVQGTNGSLLASILEFIPTIVYCKEPRVLFDRGHNFRSFGPANLFLKELSTFVEMLRSGQLNDWSLLESVEMARFIDTMLREHAAS